MFLSFESSFLVKKFPKLYVNPRFTFMNPDLLKYESMVSKKTGYNFWTT